MLSCNIFVNHIIPGIFAKIFYFTLTKIHKCSFPTTGVLRSLGTTKTKQATQNLGQDICLASTWQREKVVYTHPEKMYAQVQDKRMTWLHKNWKSEHTVKLPVFYFMGLKTTFRSTRSSSGKVRQWANIFSSVGGKQTIIITGWTKSRDNEFRYLKRAAEIPQETRDNIKSTL